MHELGGYAKRYGTAVTEEIQLDLLGTFDQPKRICEAFLLLLLTN